MYIWFDIIEILFLSGATVLKSQKPCSRVPVHISLLAKNDGPCGTRKQIIRVLGQWRRGWQAEGLRGVFVMLAIDITDRVAGPGGGDLVLTLPGCVCPKVKDMGPFLASRE